MGLESFVRSHCRAEPVRILIPADLPMVPPLPAGGSQPALCVKAKSDTADLRDVVQPVPTKEWSECFCPSAVLLCQSVQCNQFRGKINRDSHSG